MYPKPKYSEDVLFVSCQEKNKEKWLIELIDHLGNIVFHQYFKSDSQYNLKLSEPSYIVRLANKERIIYQPLFTSVSLS